ncbi:MAG: AMP-binding protein [Spongiibacteraceae bacterium]
MIDTPDIVLATLIARQAAALPNLNVLTFLSIADNGDYIEETRTFPQLHVNAQALARELKKLGIGHHDNFALMMNNHPEFVEAMSAASILGATFVPVDPRTMGTKLSYMLDFTDCKGVICADYCVDSVLAVAADCKQLEWLIVVSTAAAPKHIASTHFQVRDYAHVIATPGDELPIAEQSLDEPMFMMFTSGTTGNPKAVIHSHRKYMLLATSMAQLGVGANDKLYTGLSLTHVNAQNTLRNALALGVPAVFSRKFTKSRLWDICRRYHCTVFNLLGGMIPEIYAVPEQPDDANNPVRLIFSSGMPAHIWEKFKQRFGVELAEGYGATEGGGLSNPPGSGGPVGSIGKPSQVWEAAILDESGNPCPSNVEGEICFRRRDGEPVTVDYYKNSEASSDKVRGGWLHMGDLGHCDENGWFYFHHRVGGGVRRNGDFVNTTVVESVLTQSPLIADVFVYGVATANNVAGEKTLVAAIVPTDTATFSETDLLNFCRTQLEKNDVPEIFQVLDEIPKTISEKPIEKACIELLRNTHQL